MVDVITRKKLISLIPSVFGAGAQIPGTELGPVEMKKHGLERRLGEAGLHAAWYRDPEALYQQQQASYEKLPALGTPERSESVLKNCRSIARDVKEATESDLLPVTLGGDHSMAAGTIAGFAQAKKAHGRIGLIWVDAHSDIHTPETSHSQALHGMPVASLLGLGDKKFATIGGAEPVLKPQNVVYIGLRSTEPEENRRISDLGIHAFNMAEISGADMKKVFSKALKAISKDIDYLVLSIDLDAFDPGTAPAVGSPEAQGFKREEILGALRDLSKLRAPDMVEVVEFNPRLAGAEQTYALLEDVLKAALSAPEPGF